MQVIEDGNIHNYTLGQLQAYYTKQTTLYNENDQEGSSDNGIDDYDEVNGDNNNDTN